MSNFAFIALYHKGLNWQSWAFEILIFTLSPRDQSRSKCIVHDKASWGQSFHSARLKVAAETDSNHSRCRS